MDDDYSSQPYPSQQHQPHPQAFQCHPQRSRPNPNRLNSNASASRLNASPGPSPSRDPSPSRLNVTPMPAIPAVPQLPAPPAGVSMPTSVSAISISHPSQRQPFTPTPAPPSTVSTPASEPPPTVSILAVQALYLKHCTQIVLCSIIIIIVFTLDLRPSACYSRTGIATGTSMRMGCAGTQIVTVPRRWRSGLPIQLRCPYMVTVHFWRNSTLKK